MNRDRDRTKGKEALKAFSEAEGSVGNIFGLKGMTDFPG